MSARYLRSMAHAVVPFAVTILLSCAVNSPPPPSGGGESAIDTIKAGAAAEYPDSPGADYEGMFLEIHSELTSELRKIEGTGKGGTRLAEIQSIVKTAEEFYLEGSPLVAIRLLIEAELLLKQAP